MFERFTDRARRVVVLAQTEARLLGHNYIGTEHLLLGLLAEGEGVAARALESLNVPLDDVRDQVVKVIGRGQSDATGHIPFTPRAKKVLEISLREALQLSHNYIGTEHILLGLVREGEGVGARVLQHAGVDLNSVRQAVVSLLAGYSEAPSGSVSRSRTGSSEEPPAEPAVIGPEQGPFCAQCRMPLAETATYRVMDVPDAERKGERTPFKLVFCRGCGTSLGTGL